MTGKENILLSVENLSTHYFSRGGLIKAVDNISFNIKKGTIFALVGQSGCGKTATALSILRLISKHQGKIVKGRIFLDGQNLLKLKESQMRKIRGAEIAMIFQNPVSSLNPVYTVGNQIAETIKLHQKKDAKRAYADTVEMLRKVGISRPEKGIRQYPHQFSGGMLQRVMIAMALSCNPKLIIADEPTSSLDVTAERAILDLLCDLKRAENISVLLITHNLNIVADRADEVAVMHQGKIVEKGDTEKIIKNPSHPYTQSLIADASKNRL